MEDETFFGQGVWPSRVASKFYSFFGVRALPNEANLKFRNSWGEPVGWMDLKTRQAVIFLLGRKLLETPASWHKTARRERKKNKKHSKRARR
jgi:hypothetical protein